MRNEAGSTEFEGADAHILTEDPLAGATGEAKGRVGVKATILAGLTLGTMSAVAVTANLSTVVSVNGTVA
jgi:hypothetical protein